MDRFILFLLIILFVIPLKSQTNKSEFWGISPTFSTFIDSTEFSYYKEIGLKTIRIHLQSHHKYCDYDNVLSKCKELGIDVMMLVSYESYASETDKIDVGWGPILHYTNSLKLIETLETAVPYFQARGVKCWEIWNEENGSWHLYPDEYAELICTVYERFKYSSKWDVGATIVFGGIDAVGAFHSKGTNPAASKYVKEVFNTEYFTNFKNKYGCYPYDVMAVHPYYTYTTEKFNFNISDVVLNTMNINGDSLKPIWITELGTKESNPEKNADILEAYVRSAYVHPRVERFFQFKYTYHGTAETTDNHNYFSLVEKVAGDSKPIYKPAWYRYKKLSRQLSK